MSRPKESEAGTLERYRIALDNAENQPEIAAIMAELGYDSKVISEGKTLLAKTRTAYDFNKTEDDETSAASAGYKAARNELEEFFSMQRKKAKVIFRNDALICDRLAISGAYPRTFIPWLEAVRKFYSVASSDEDIQARLSRLRLTPEDLSEGENLLSKLEEARAEYYKEKGESQDATRAKDAAFSKLDYWMSDFYAVANIALEDKPQLLESLGKRA